MSDMQNVAESSIRMSKAQAKVTVKTIRRSQIDPAPYNPRTIHPYNEEKLKKSLKKWGLVETLVWNEATGVLVGGHQRLKQLDAIENYPEKGDYLLVVSAGNWSVKEERELNVLLNNPALQGDYDQDALAALVADKDVGFDLDAAGFDPMDLQVALDAPGNDEVFSLEKQSPAVQAAAASAQELAAKKIEARQKKEKTEEERAAELADIKAAKKEHREKAREKDDTEFILVVVCKNRAEQTVLCEALGADPNSKYADGYRLMSMLGLTAGGESEES